MIPDDAAARIAEAHHLGYAQLAAVGAPREPLSVALAVEAHRWAWRPANCRLLLVAESHVFTSEEDTELRVSQDRLPPEARHTPDQFVRLIYCLAYGEDDLLSEPPRARNTGTLQFWDIFGRLAETGRQPRKATLAERLRWKVFTLLTLQEKGVWLLDSSLHAFYMPGGTQVGTGHGGLDAAIHEIWWRYYGSTLVAETDAPLWAIGGQVATRLSALGVPLSGWIYQPQARVTNEVREQRWREFDLARGTI